MNVYVPRTCTEVTQHRWNSPLERPKPKPLREFRDRPAIVLLGAPGTGKTEMFRHEAAAQTEAFKLQQEEVQEAGCYVTARDFVTFDDRLEWHGKTLFIDGLDEMRAGTSDRRTPFDQIRAKLDRLEQPCFRLSCREADWFGATDRTHLESVSSNGEVLVLRLKPLSDEGVREILSGYQSIEDVEGFISAAQQRGIDKLLENPQTLKMLATAVADGSWPETRTQTFESACLKLLSEHNPEHRQAVTSNYSDTELLDAAGRLCALLLLSGRARCAVTTGTADADSISLPEISGPRQEILNRTIRTKLFKVENGLAEPIHRHIAEFLAGRHLAGLIDNGLPVCRILALLTGEEDGGLVSALRGLAAWLAAHSKMGRYALIERDPEGAVLYGDVKPFSVDEKRLILDCLARETGRDPWSIANNNRELDSRWGDLATPDMADSFVRLLAQDRKTNAEESVVCAVLTAMHHGTIPSGLKPVTMNLIKDGNGGIETRMLALKTYIKQSEGDQQVKLDLKSLLDLIYSGVISDPYDRLLGRLLFHLYPEEISPLDVCRYFRDPKSDTISSRYQFFWSTDLIQKTANTTQLAEVLDGFAALYNNPPSTNQDGTHVPHRMSRTLESLLAKFFEYSNNEVQVDVKRLFNWLALLAKVRRNHGDKKFLQTIRQWLSSHPKHYKAICKMAIERPMPLCTKDDFLFRATPPKDFASWCIDQALKATENNLAFEFLDEAVRCLKTGRQSGGFSLEALEMRLADKPDLFKHYKELLALQRQGGDRQKQRGEQASENQRKAAEEQKEKSDNWRNAVKSHEAELRENRAPPGFLHQLAKAYFGFFLDINGDTGGERVLSLLGGDEHLTDLVLNAFRESTKRNDLPQASEIFRLSTQNKQHHLALPFMAGCKELADEIRLDQPPLNRNGVRRALALHFTEALSSIDNWLRLDPILIHQPEVVAKSLVQAFRATIRKDTAHFIDLHRLADDPSYSEIARIAVPQLIDAFPHRCKVKQLKVLKQILVAALKHCEKDAFLVQVEKRLSLKSLNTAQRVYWLAARILSQPQSALEPLAKVLSGGHGERQTTHLAAFLTEELNPWIAKLNMDTKKLLVQAIAKLYMPYTAGWISEAEGAGRPLVRNLVEQIAATPTKQAAKVLEELAQHPALCQWHPRLLHAAHEQREVRREAHFTHATPEQVQEVLESRCPANSADLAALVADHLADLAGNIRHGKTSDWRQYWNTDSARHPKEPKHEGLCRDALLSDLLLRLAPLGINAEPEGQYGNDRRADIRICYAGLNVPIEVKNSYHRELWTALHHKLICQYAQEPGANGHGIYLVFWFGPKWTKATPPQGVGPKTAQELEKSLCDTLSNAEARKVSVVVVDVSDPSVDSISR